MKHVLLIVGFSCLALEKLYMYLLSQQMDLIYWSPKVLLWWLIHKVNNAKGLESQINWKGKIVTKRFIL